MKRTQNAKHVYVRKWRAMLCKMRTKRKPKRQGKQEDIQNKPDDIYVCRCVCVMLVRCVIKNAQ